MFLHQFFVEGIGHASYLIGSDQTGEAAVIDPGLDLQPYLDLARERKLQIRYALETHLHNDFVSGAAALGQRPGVEHVASAEGHLKAPYRGVREGDELRLGELTIRVLFTPGHTPEHVSYVVTDTSRAEAPVLAFTGGDLLVGSVGRPDLLGKELGDKLAPLLYDSLHDKLLKLDDYVEVLPTHGAGSLCGRSISSKRTSTIGYERRFNEALQKKTKEEFVRFVLAGNPGIPTYYRRMRPLNQEGADPWTAPEPRALTPDETAHLIGHGALVLDARPNVAFGGAHIPGAFNIGLDAMFATWVGWLVPNDVPLILVLQHEDQWDEAVTALGRIGYQKVAGYLRGGMAAWVERALPLAQVPQWTVQELNQNRQRDDLLVLDVRTDAEWDGGHVPGALHVQLGDLPDRVADLDPRRPTAVICGSGYRSSAGTSILQREGFTQVYNTLGGMTAWTASHLPESDDHATSTENVAPAGRTATTRHKEQMEV